jgi:energy-converting hydrogenase Eha subunit B
MKRSLFIFIVMSATVSSEAICQQVATYAQYMFNGLAINPAYAGSHEALSATALARFQTLDYPVLRKHRHSHYTLHCSTSV